MKLSSRAILKIARLYKLADDNFSTKQLRNLRINPNESFVTAEFIIDKQRYGLIFSSLLDDESYHEMWPNLPDDVQILTNPLDEEAIITPFQGKNLMVFNFPRHAQRLDQFLSSEFDQNISRSQWQKHIKAGHVLVNGKIEKSTKREVSLVDEVAISIPKDQSADLDIPIIYEDENIVVINKPAGVLTHAKGGIANEKTVADWLRDRTSFGLDGDRPGIVHRLDRDTSGVLVGARNPASAKDLQAQFADRRIKKTYLAVVEGHLKHQAAEIDLPIARHPSVPSTFRVDPKGKSAQTIFEVLAVNDKFSLVKLSPKTGRTHQLRVHMAHLGNPIVGDRVYGQSSDRLYLHAYKIELTKLDGEKQTFTADLPEQFLTNFPDVKL
ncbi:RNA pseudouridine synthase [Candidatus Saccharibacteria bacterium]|nr:MAG: RNA pseudouridine synthase [Candidatus Saccharibacteria bacterium]